MKRSEYNARRRHKSSHNIYDPNQSSKARTLRTILSYFVLTIIAVALAWLWVGGFGMRVGIIGSSMKPSLVSGQQVLVDRVSSFLGSVRRGEVVAFYPGGNEQAHPYVKRVVALPGETVQISDGQLLINGKPAEEEGEYDKIEDPGIAAAGLTLGDDEYFVLGDNRNSSEDSRSASIGAVRKSEIIGRVWLALPADGSGLHFVR